MSTSRPHGGGPAQARKPLPARGLLLNHARYDDVNRLCTVRETSSTTPLAPRACDDATGLSGDTWYQSYMFDRWGNMAVKATPGVTPHPLTVSLLSSYNTANNRLTGSNWAYDAAGNMTTHGGWTLAYDAANRMKTSQPSGGSVTSYVYDADGRRVKKTTGAASTYFIYDAFGELAAEYVSTDPTGSAETHYLTTDHLGSTRLVTNQTGAVVSRHDYLPFGWELYSGLTGRTNGHGYLTSPEGVHTPTQRFTGKERDTETGLDYFGARYLSGVLGRFTSPDPFGLGARIRNPQSWNMYAYALNNPQRYVDPTGMWPTPIHNRIIDKAFPGLSGREKALLQRVSSHQDRLLGGQSRTGSYQPLSANMIETPTPSGITDLEGAEKVSQHDWQRETHSRSTPIRLCSLAAQAG